MVRVVFIIVIREFLRSPHKNLDQCFLFFHVFFHESSCLGRLLSITSLPSTHPLKSQPLLSNLSFPHPDKIAPNVRPHPPNAFVFAMVLLLLMQSYLLM